MSNGEREYLSPGEVARILHVSPKTVARWADLGWLSCVITLGGHRRFRRDEIEAIESEMSDSGPPRGREHRGGSPEPETGPN